MKKLVIILLSIFLIVYLIGCWDVGSNRDESNEINYSGTFVNKSKNDQETDYDTATKDTWDISPVESEPEKIEPKEKKSVDTSAFISPELREFLEAYEAFMNQYCDFMMRYDSGDFSMLGEYMELMVEYLEFAEAAENWDTDDMTDAEFIYYMEVMNRVNARLLQIA